MKRSKVLTKFQSTYFPLLLLSALFPPMFSYEKRDQQTSQEEKEMKFNLLAENLHHLVGTKNIRGIYKPPEHYSKVRERGLFSTSFITCVRFVHFEVKKKLFCLQIEVLLLIASTLFGEGYDALLLDIKT